MTERAGRPGTSLTLVLLGCAVVTAAVAVLPAGASLGGGEPLLGLGGLSATAAVTIAWGVAAVTCALFVVDQRLPRGAWLIAAVGVLIALARQPILVLGLLLLAAMTLPRLQDGPGAGGWARVLTLGSLAGFALAGPAIRVLHNTDETVATVLLFGFLAVVGAIPFGWHLARWMEQAPLPLAALVGAGLAPCLVAALVAAQPTLSAVHAGPRAGAVIGLFGATTATFFAFYSLGARSWRALAVRTIPCEVGLALVAVATFDIRGLQGAALTLALLAVTRPVLVFADVLVPRRGVGLLAAAVVIVAAAGLPPTLGFPARLLVIEAAVRSSPVVSVLTVVALVVELTAIAGLLRHRLAEPVADPGIEGGARSAARVLTLASSAVLLAGGLAPGVLLRVFHLG